MSVGKTPVLSAEQARHLLRSLPDTTLSGLRDRALIATMLYTFARVSAALSVDLRDVYREHHRLHLRLREKGGKAHRMPCHHTLEAWLTAYMAAAGLGDDPGAPLFQSLAPGNRSLSGRRLSRTPAWSMVRRRARETGIDTPVTNHTFRGTGHHRLSRAPRREAGGGPADGRAQRPQDHPALRPAPPSRYPRRGGADPDLMPEPGGCDHEENANREHQRRSPHIRAWRATTRSPSAPCPGRDPAHRASPGDLSVRTHRAVQIGDSLTLSTASVGNAVHGAVENDPNALLAQDQLLEWPRSGQGRGVRQKNLSQFRLPAGPRAPASYYRGAEHPVTAA